MAKRPTDELKAIRSKHETRKYSQGIGYYLPPGMSRSEWQKLKRKWDKKLLSTGHDEIEQFSNDYTGHFSPFFTKTKHGKSLSGSSATVARFYNPHTEEYYRRLGLFYHHANFHNVFRGKSRLYKRITKLLSEGATYQKLVNWLRTDAPPSLRAKKSIFWAFYHVKHLEKRMKEWFDRHPEMLES